MLDLVGNPEYWLSYDEVHLKIDIIVACPEENNFMCNPLSEHEI